MKVYVSLLFCLFFAGLSPTYGQQAHQQIESQIIALEHKYWEALRNKEAKTLAEIRAEDFREADQDGVLDKKQAAQAESDMEITSYALRNEKVEALQPNVALLTYEVAYKGSYKDKDISSPHAYVVSMYVRRNRSWRLAYSQETAAKENLPDAFTETYPPSTTAANIGSPAQKTPQSGADTLERQLLANEKAIWDLSIRNDFQGWSQLTSDDALAVYDTGYASKAEVLEAIQGMDGGHYSMEDVRIIPVGDSAGLVVYKVTQDWKEGGKKLERQYYVSSLWQKREGKWLSRFWQETDTTLPDNQLSAQALAKETEILETLKHNDWPAFSDLLADDVVAIDEDGIVGKKELIDGIKSAGTVFTDYKMENVKVIPQGNGAIVAYKETLVGTQNGKPFTWHIYTHSHWERRGGKWLMTMFQDSMAK